MRRLLPLLALLAGAVGCATDGLVGRTFEPDVYVVRPGDTVYSIAWRYRVDPDELIRWNDLADPDQLRVGQRLRLSPRASGDVADAGPARGPEPAAGKPDGPDRTSALPEPAPAERASPAGSTGVWRWPTEGRVVGTFDDGRVAGRGVDIAGERGQPIQATAAGEVVYSGEGLQAYGRLVIIRHSGEYLSAYAHNSELLVREGQRVTAGQQIARMGESGDGAAMLHFEIRRAGKPVDPMEYLPPRQ